MKEMNAFNNFKFSNPINHIGNPIHENGHEPINGDDPHGGVLGND
jgi:hypothetical protein